MRTPNRRNPSTDFTIIHVQRAIVNSKTSFLYNRDKHFPKFLISLRYRWIAQESENIYVRKKTNRVNFPVRFLTKLNTNVELIGAWRKHLCQLLKRQLLSLHRLLRNRHIIRLRDLRRLHRHCGRSNAAHQIHKLTSILVNSSHSPANRRGESRFRILADPQTAA